jgi:hypothetical protein
MLAIPTTPQRDRQVTPEGPILLWRDRDRGGREGLLLVPRGCPFPTCPDRHVDLAVYPLTPAVAVVEVDEERVWTIDKDGAIDRLWLEFEADVELTPPSFEPDLLAEPDLVGWVKRELDAELLAALARELERARARNVALLRRPVRAGPPVGRNEPCPCGSGKKSKRCCLRAG